ncbi:MAG TPA: MgtC/SapB family protein [Caulobacteraceae bacterium]
MEWWRPDIVWPILGALGAGAAVGLEREFRGQPAGLRTHLLVCLTAAFLMIMSIEQAVWSARLPMDVVRIDPVRMAHGVLTGVGFLCGGVIFRTGVTVHGLTTAASLWITSALGLLFGAGLYPLAIGATIIVLLVLSALRLFDKFIPQQSVAHLKISFERERAPTGQELRAQLHELGIRSTTFTSRMLERGAVLEFSSNLRGRNWSHMERLLEALRDDARVLEYELMPRKP